MSETIPSAVVPVRLIGGPEDWHGQTLTIHTREELAAPRASLGTYLVSSGAPASHPDPGARAVYEPDDEPAAVDVWFFRGWVPPGPNDPEERVPTHLVDVDVATDAGGLPARWTDADGAQYPVVRVLAHWQATGEDHLAPDVWHVATAGGADVALHRHPGDGWQAGPLPVPQERSSVLD